MLQSALLFYQKLVKDLQKYGPKMNPYEPCFFNGMNNRKQLTVTLHVNYLKLLHMHPFYITLFVCYLSRLYGD